MGREEGLAGSERERETDGVTESGRNTVAHWLVWGGRGGLRAKY